MNAQLTHESFVTYNYITEELMLQEGCKETIWSLRGCLNNLPFHLPV